MRKLRSVFPVAPRSSSAASDSDDGLTLVEMVVAMMVFAVISLGVAYSMLAVLQTSREARGRQVAANLAAQEIDLARSAEVTFELDSDTFDRVVDGVPYTINRTTSWTDSSGADLGCSNAGGALQYLRVNIAVTWPGVTADRAVRADTVVAPSSKINEPNRGTILIKVVDRDGVGVPNVTVSVAAGSPTNGAVTPTGDSLPRPTDDDGCTYALKILPGNYVVSPAKTNFVDVKQRATPSTPVTVVRGASVAASFELGERATSTITLAPDSTSSRVPSNLPVTFFSSFETFVSTTAVLPGTGKVRTAQLYPFRSGYEAVAGAFRPETDASSGCLSPDPRSWTPSGVPAGPIVTEPGSASTAAIPMGLVQVQTTTSFSGSLAATSAVAPDSTGDPGCAVPMSLSFASGLPTGGGTVLLALPYGSWKVTAGTQTMGIASGSAVTAVSAGIVSPGGIITLDPRPAVTP